MTNHSSSDNRRVALIKSLATNNRFYVLVDPERGLRNADVVSRIPDDLLLGVAYPCLEDGLNDFAVIRTTFETLDLFPEDDPMRGEMMGIISDARGNLVLRLTELRDKIRSNRAHFLGTDYDEFKTYTLDICRRGYPRRNLDSMMKLNVFSSVAETEGHGDSSELLYHYELANGFCLQQAIELPAREFIVILFEDVLRSVMNDENYKSKYLFDRNVFQKFIAVMFVNYATTDPMFYGINRQDYGYSMDKEMDNTPLFLAISRELREIEQRIALNGSLPKAPLHLAEPARVEPDFSAVPELPADRLAEPAPIDQISFETAAHLLPDELVNEDVLMGPIISLCSAAALLIRKNDPETQRFARVILADASKLFGELKRLGIVSPIANDPTEGLF